MEAGTADSPRQFDHLREHSIGLPQVLFQSITHMAPAAAVAYSIFISVPYARQALPLSVGPRADRVHLRRDGDRPAREAVPVRRRHVHVRRALARAVGRLPRRLALHPLRAARRAVPLPRVRLGDDTTCSRTRSAGTTAASGGSGSLLMTVIVFLLTYRDIRLSTTAGVILGAFEIGDLRARSRSGCSSRTPAT